ADKGGKHLLALDHDPQRRWFEFSVEMKPVQFKAQDKNQLGAFFGWQPPLAADPARLQPYVAIQLDKQQGLFRMSCPYVLKALKDGEGTPTATLALPADKATLPLSRPGPWHALRIRVVDDHITIIADDGASTEIDLGQLKPLDPVFAHLEPRGALGIWTNGE